jgi:hypothetical protein
MPFIASSVALGGVFSPRIDFGGGLELFLRDGVGVTSRDVLLSGDVNTSELRLELVGVIGGRSGERSGVLSSMARMSLTVLFCRLCRRRCAAPLMRDRSGLLSGMGLTV